MHNAGRSCTTEAGMRQTVHDAGRSCMMHDETGRAWQRQATHAQIHDDHPSWTWQKEDTIHL